MQYRKIVHGKFVDRPNRFIAHVEIDGNIETVHVKNTGRCKELLLPGVEVVLEDFRDISSERKTKFDLIAVYKVFPEDSARKPVLINMDSQAPNKVVLEYLNGLKNEDGTPYFDLIHPEYTFGNSRVDFYLERKKSDSISRILLEIKGCTLEKNGTGYFPDAPTERGVKHLKELTAAQKNGYSCYVGFVIQIPDVNIVYPNNETHPEFGKALEDAVKAGVKVLYFCCDVKDSELRITHESKKNTLE